MKRHLAALGLIVLALPSLIAGEKSEPPWPMPPKEYFLARIPAPPADDSALDKADLDFTVALQDAATPAEIAHAVQSAGFTVFTFAEVLGPEFTAERYPRTAAFFARLAETANGVKNSLKDHFRRPRPVDGHKGLVKELVPYEDGFSYPSGHATRSWLFALVLGELDPPARPAFLRAAAQVGLDRVIGGMHYQSDVVNSRALAELLFECLQKDAAFSTAVQELKAAEWTPPPKPR
jgi:acid phosphatase (class A)